jgi:hypothetical protein
VRTIEQYKSTLWNRSRSDWEHTDRDHGDAVDVAKYLQRSIRWNRDCRPPAPVVDMPAYPRQKPTGWAGVFGGKAR